MESNATDKPVPREITAPLSDERLIGDRGVEAGAETGTLTLFAALNVLEGTVIGECQPRHRHQEFLRFLDRIDHSVDTALEIHLILDNYGTHKHPAVKKRKALPMGTSAPRPPVEFLSRFPYALEDLDRRFSLVESELGVSGREI